MTEDERMDADKKARRAVAGDPAVGAINDLSEAMTKSFALLEGEQSAAKRQAQDLFTSLDKKLDETRTEMAIQGKVHADRINSLDRRSAAIGLSGPRDIDGICLAALGDEERKQINAIGWSMPKAIRERKDDLPLLSSPVGATMIANWFLASYKIQKRRCATKAEEDKQYATMEKIEKAVKELFPHETAANLDTSAGTLTLGGHWLPDPVANELYRLITDNSVISSQATHVPMTTKTLDLPTEGSSSLQVSWGTENSPITDSIPSSNAVGKVILTANRLNGIATSSIEELQDSAVSIMSWIQTKLTEMAGREIDKQALEGTGSPFTGLSNAAGVNVMATAGTNGDVLTYLMLAQQVFGARERASRNNARWYCSPELMAQIIGLTTTDGMPVVQFGNVPNAFAASILGYPVEVHSVIRADRTYGTGSSLSNLYFGPPSQIVIGDRMGMSWDVTDQVGFTSAQVTMRLITRLGMGVAVPAAFSRKQGIKSS